MYLPLWAKAKEQCQNLYSDFDWEDLGMDEQEFEDYKSKYLDLYEKVKNENQKEKSFNIK